MNISEHTMTQPMPKIPFSEKVKEVVGIFGIQLGETPRYTVLARDGEIEIRQYDPLLMASTSVSDSSSEDPRREAFQRLASYIFGKNNSAKHIDMTAPVFQDEVPSAARMSFILPSEYTLSSIPKPLDHHIEFSEVPRQMVAVLKYSGLNEAKKSREKTAELLRWIEKKSLTPKGLRVAEYNGPLTLSFFRKNEIQVPIEIGKRH